MKFWRNGYELSKENWVPNEDVAKKESQRLATRRLPFVTQLVIFAPLLYTPQRVDVDDVVPSVYTQKERSETSKTFATS